MFQNNQVKELTSVGEETIDKHKAGQESGSWTSQSASFPQENVPCVSAVESRFASASVTTRGRMCHITYGVIKKHSILCRTKQTPQILHYKVSKNMNPTNRKRESKVTNVFQVEYKGLCKEKTSKNKKKFQQPFPLFDM